MSLQKKWITKDNEVTEELIDSCDGNRVLAVLLKNRGIDTPEKIYKFLNPLKAEFINPDVFVDMEKSVSRIADAVNNKEHITVYGDFDADGVTSTAILFLTLKKIGADVDYYLPDRATESHGLNTKALVKIISKQKTKLIITVDCGISNVNEVNFASGFKTDVIITDHHEAPEILPKAFAVINPKVKDAIDANLDLDKIKSLSYLAGVGVVFKLVCKLLEKYKCEEYIHELLPLVAVGTIGDVVELLDENRSLVSMGLELIKKGAHKGLQKLLESASVDDITKITSETVAFTVVPRLNAAGRLDSPQSAITLLISDNDAAIENSVKHLNELNTLRQNLCEETFLSAKKMYEADINNNKTSIIMHNSEWHLGIIGIVASKLVETYNKPVFLMTTDTINPNIIRCSCRSISGINIHNVLSEHKELFEGFGGHKMAAGFSFNKDKITFENFKKLLIQTLEEHSQGFDLSVSVEADMVLEPCDINVKTVELIDKMQPFGAGNPPPLFIMNNLVLNSYKMMGQNANHLKMFVSKNSLNPLECVKWNCSEFNIPVNSQLDILFSLKLNLFNNNTIVQLILSDIHTAALKKTDIRLLDHRNKKNILMQVLDFILSTKKSTAIFLENPNLKKKLNLPENIENKIFSSDNIPENTEQIMFFDCPNSVKDFYRILKYTDAKIVHLMNFDISQVQEDDFISKLSGMIKYALTHLDGKFSIKRASCALGVDKEILECALNLLENTGMLQVEHIDDNEYKILSISPIELSKIKNDDMYFTLDEMIKNINDFRSYYLNSSTEAIKADIDGELKLEL